MPPNQCYDYFEGSSPYFQKETFKKIDCVRTKENEINGLIELGSKEENNVFQQLGNAEVNFITDDAISLNRFYEDCSLEEAECEFLNNNITDIITNNEETSNSNSNSNSNPFSVLGISLDLGLSEETYLFKNFDNELEQLLDENFFAPGNSIFEDCLDKGKQDVLFNDDCWTKTEENEHLDTNDIINMFPHMHDEKNRRRRCLLYENSQVIKNQQKTTSSNIIGIGSRDKNVKTRHAALINHDYTNKAEIEKSIVCPIPNCKRIYAKSSHLKAHLRRHSGEKPFVCDWNNCSWKFSRSDELARHKRSHYGIKPYKCEICEKAFARSDHLAKHRKVHTKKAANLQR